MSSIGHWWRLPDRYDQLVAHLEARRIGTFTRTVIALIAAIFALDAVATIWTPVGARTGVELACAWISASGAAIGAALWLRRWPSRKASICFAALSSVSVTLIVLSLSDSLVALWTCTVFAAVGSYIALFHAPPLMTCNVAVAAVVGGIEAVRVAPAYAVLGALCAYSAMLMLNLAGPFGIQAVVAVLGTDALRAERDQLTGLLNRRAFRRRAVARLEQSRDRLSQYVITVIDLDRFKQLNDNYGHHTGDDALVAVARALSDTLGETAVICRSGGEEFVIADVCLPDKGARIAQQLCTAIAELPFDITASVGTVDVFPAFRTGEGADLLTELIAAADTAMYVAKRRGGNQIHHHNWTLAPGDEDDDYRGIGA